MCSSLIVCAGKGRVWCLCCCGLAAIREVRRVVVWVAALQLCGSPRARLRLFVLFYALYTRVQLCVGFCKIGVSQASRGAGPHAADRPGAGLFGRTPPRRSRSESTYRPGRRRGGVGREGHAHAMGLDGKGEGKGAGPRLRAAVRSDGARRALMTPHMAKRLRGLRFQRRRQ